MLRYDIRKKGNKRCKGNENIIRKNYIKMNKEELSFLKSQLVALDIKKIDITNHATEKNLLSKNEIKKILKNKSFKIIDYNYNLKTKEERILIRSREEYLIKNHKGEKEKVYIKVVISITENKIITQWANDIEGEKEKNNNCITNYIDNFDIINKKIKFK